jgi:hypothetical protein
VGARLRSRSQAPGWWIHPDGSTPPRRKVGELAPALRLGAAVRQRLAGASVKRWGGGPPLRLSVDFIYGWWIHPDGTTPPKTPTWANSPGGWILQSRSPQLKVAGCVAGYGPRCSFASLLAQLG